MTGIHSPFSIRPARSEDCETIAGLIRELAAYERLEDHVKASAEDLRRNLFGPRPYAEALVAGVDGAAAGFASSSTISRRSAASRGSISRTCS